MEKNEFILPVVGKGATIRYGSDSYAYEVISVNEKNKSCFIQPYKQKIEPGTSIIYTEDQNYIYDELEGEPFELVFRYGSWKRKTTQIVPNEPYWSNSSKEERMTYYDENNPVIINKLGPLTKMITEYHTMPISFGNKRFYRDPHF